MNECKCTQCSECGGSGNVWFSFSGQYLGKNKRMDDMDEMETCEECNGSGLIDECDHCREIREQDEEDYYLQG